MARRFPRVARPTVLGAARAVLICCRYLNWLHCGRLLSNQAGALATGTQARLGAAAAKDLMKCLRALPAKVTHPREPRHRRAPHPRTPVRRAPNLAFRHAPSLSPSATTRKRKTRHQTQNPRLGGTRSSWTCFACVRVSRSRLSWGKRCRGWLGRASWTVSWKAGGLRMRWPCSGPRSSTEVCVARWVRRFSGHVDAAARARLWEHSDTPVGTSPLAAPTSTVACRLPRKGHTTDANVLLLAWLSAGSQLPDQPMRLLEEGAFHKVPLLVGTNQDEVSPRALAVPIVSPPIAAS